MIWLAKNVVRFGRWYVGELTFEFKHRFPILRPAEVDIDFWTSGFACQQLGDQASLLPAASAAARDMAAAADNLNHRSGFHVKNDGEGSVRIQWEPGADRRFDALVAAITPRWYTRYLGRLPEAQYYMVQRSVPTTTRDRFGRLGFHIDSHGRSLKTYVYLSDVTLAEGPLVVVPGRNHLTADQFRRAWLVHRSQPDLQYERIDPYLYYVKPGHSQFPALEAAAVPLVGPAGTVVNFDTRTFHKAGEQTSGERLVFAVYWW